MIRFPLRFKLVLAAVLVEAAMLVLLVANSVRIMEEVVVEQAVVRASQLKLMFNAALGAPLAAGDTATLQDILNHAALEEGLRYLVLLDSGGRVVAASGWNPAQPLPGLEYDIARKDAQTPARFDDGVLISYEGKVRGDLRFGLSTGFLETARARLLWQSVLISGPAILLSAFVLALIGYWLTRHLAELTRAAHRMAGGERSVPLPVRTRDEAGELTEAFNAMAEAVERQFGALRESEAKFHAIADHSHNIECWYGRDGRLIWINPSVERMTGYTPVECMEMMRFPIPLVHRGDMRRFLSDSQRAINENTRGSGWEFRAMRKDGSYFWASVTWQPIYGPGGEYLGIRTSTQDVTLLKDSELMLRRLVSDLQRAQQMQQRYLGQAREAHARLTSLLSAMGNGILFVGRDGVVEYCNPALLRVLDIPASEQLIGRPAGAVQELAASAPVHAPEFADRFLAVPDPQQPSETFEILMQDGRTVMQASHPVRGEDGSLLGQLWIFEDVTRERQTAEQLVYLAERDPLTGLFNRRRFEEELTRMVIEAERRGSNMALLFFDLDDFKYVNDTFGHRAGDALLIRVAGEVATQVRRNEIFCRLGGDEFAILVPEGTDKDMRGLAERIAATISQVAFTHEGQSLRVTSSIGVALYPEQAGNMEELVAHADAAMYQAKEAGKNAWRIYRHDVDASERVLARLAWNERIAHALDTGLMRLHFQGVYRAADGTLSHLEALARIADEKTPGHFLMPAAFIPAAEKSGKVLDIDRWVIREAVRFLGQAPMIPPIAVNISGRSFDDPSLPQYIDAELKRLGVAPGRLIVELTETAAVSDLHDAQRFISALRRTGCLVCLDDFGSGFSSFAYLKHLEVDMLKIDGMFIRDLPGDHDNQVFVKAMLDVAHGMRKTTVAEFVEDRPTLEMLKRFGVDMVQGFQLDMPRGDHPALGGAGQAALPDAVELRR